MGDRAFARARTAGKYATEAGLLIEPAPKPGLTSPSAPQYYIGARKMTRERQPAAERPVEKQTPTPPAACNRSALSALIAFAKAATWLDCELQTGALMPFPSIKSQSQGLLFSEAREPCAEAAFRV